jgi:hypothetical protein
VSSSEKRGFWALISVEISRAAFAGSDGCSIGIASGPPTAIASPKNLDPRREA